MGLIKAIKNTIGGTLADQWKEFFYCDSIPNDILVVKGKKRVSSGSSNTKGNDNIISNGSGIAVADGQCMIIVDQGKVVEFCAEPGEYKFDTSSEPSVFTGDLGDSLADTLKTMLRRFTYGGDTGKDQRVYYFNTKEIVDNKFGTPNPVPFRVVDSRIGLDIDVSVRANGVYSYRITNPVKFYENVCGNIAGDYAKEEIDRQLKTEFISALAPALGKLSALEVRPSEIPAHHNDLENAMNEVLSSDWSARGISVVSVAIASITLPDEDAELIKTAQKTAMYRDPSFAAATLTVAQADAMKMAAQNQGGAAVGFMGMNMAAQSGGVDAQALYTMAAQNQQNQQNAAPVKDEKTWKCSCGAENSGKFCSECGNAKPADGWTCSCGKLNKGKFCSECGAKKPAGERIYKCDKCGWEPEDKNTIPKFCPECGDRFDDEDTK